MRLEDTADAPKNVFERKRTRSSLDVKVPDGEHLTRPPKSKSKPHFDFSDLDGMSKEEMLQAMYDDPELAAAAAAAASAQQGTYQKKKSSSRTVDQKADKLRVKKDKGVPIIQWMVLLLLLGAVFLKLHKSSASSPTVTKVGKAKLDKSRKTGKQKGGKKAKASNKSRTTVVQDASVEKTAAVSGKANTAKNKKTRSKKTGNVAKPEASKMPEKAALETRGNESPDSASTDGSSSTDGAAQHEEVAVAPNVVNNVIETIAQATTIVDDGWQTVGAPTVESKPKEVAPTNGRSKEPDVESIVPEPLANSGDKMEEEVHAKEEEKTPVAKEPMSNGSGPSAAVIDNQPTTEPFKVKAAKKKKKKAKSPAMEKIAPIAAIAAPVENDEALAMQLQLQEEKIAEHEATRVVEEDVWEEVTIKKKKRET